VGKSRVFHIKLQIPTQNTNTRHNTETDIYIDTVNNLRK
jgi:hypothetical protein